MTSEPEHEDTIVRFLTAEIKHLRGELDRAVSPISDYVAAQRKQMRKPEVGAYHLPEPISHPTRQPQVLVVGLNPSFWEDEPDIPRQTGDPEFDLQSCLTFYGGRFTTQPQGRRHLHGILESLLTEALGMDRALGVPGGAVLCDAIPWKWAYGVGKKPEDVPESKRGLDRDLNDPEWASAAERVGRIVTALQPRLVLSLGGLVGWEIFGRAPDDNPELPLKVRVATLRAVRIEVPHLPAYHPRSFGYYSRNRGRLVAAIQDALAGRAIES